MRAFTDGYISVLLPLHLTRLGFGSITTATLVVGLVTYRFKRRHLLFIAAMLMAVHGPGFRARACVLAAPGRRVCRHLEPIIRQCQRFLAARTIVVPADSERQAAHRTFRPLRRGRITDRRGRRALRGCALLQTRSQSARADLILMRKIGRHLPYRTCDTFITCGYRDPGATCLRSVSDTPSHVLPISSPPITSVR